MAGSGMSKTHDFAKKASLYLLRLNFPQLPFDADGPIPSQRPGFGSNRAIMRQKC